MVHRIIAGNDFRLIVCAKRSMGAYLTDMDLSEVDSLRIYMTRAGRSKELQSYTLDENGNAVIYVAAQQVTAGIYGIEMVGVYGDASLRAHLTTAFQIVGAGHGDAGVLTDYSVDIVFAINVAASDVFVKASIEAHNTDPTSHPDIRALIASTRSDLEQAIEEGGADVSEDIQDLQNQINAIVADKATVSLTASPSVVFIGEQKAITLTAKSSPVATSTVIKKGNTEIQTGTTGTVTGSDTITPSSNVLLGRVPNMAHHPIAQLYRSGVDVTVNSDDVLIFDSDVSKEYLRLYQSGCLTAEELDDIRVMGLKLKHK